MKENRIISRLAIFFIIGVTMLPAIIGPMLNIGQFMGGEHRFLPLLKKGGIPILVGTLIGFLILKIILKRMNKSDFENRSSALITGSLLIYFPLIVAWTVCQVTDLIIQNSFFIDLRAPWYDTISSIPTLIWFALFPCAIASLCYGFVLMLILKKN